LLIGKQHVVFDEHFASVGQHDAAVAVISDAIVVNGRALRVGYQFAVNAAPFVSINDGVLDFRQRNKTVYPGPFIIADDDMLDERIGVFAKDPRAPVFDRDVLDCRVIGAFDHGFRSVAADYGIIGVLADDRHVILERDAFSVNAVEHQHRIVLARFIDGFLNGREILWNNDLFLGMRAAGRHHHRRGRHCRHYS